MKILITGASGFIGQYALQPLAKVAEVGVISLRDKDVSAIQFDGIDTILHLAGKAHQMEAIDPDEYFKVNHRLTLSFAKAAKAKGVSHFIFVSTVKVYGDHTSEIFNETSTCRPTDPYGESKRLAEKELLTLAEETFVVSIIRPPLVYGPKVKGNLKRLSGLIKKLPILPFGGIQNERSMVFVGNLVALIIKIIETKERGIFIAGDQSRKSTSDLVQTMMEQMEINKSNISLPRSFVLLIKMLKPQLYSRLFESYIIENQHTNKRLNFKPPFSFEEGIKCMVNSYK